MQRNHREYDRLIDEYGLIPLYNEAREMALTMSNSLRAIICTAVRNANADSYDMYGKLCIVEPPEWEKSNVSKANVCIARQCKDSKQIYSRVVISSQKATNYEYIFISRCQPSSAFITLVPCRLLQLMVERCSSTTLLSLMERYQTLFWKPFLSESVLSLQPFKYSFKYDCESYETSALGLISSLRFYYFQNHTANIEHVSCRWINDEICPVLDNCIRWCILNDRKDILFDRRHCFTVSDLQYNTGGYNPFGYVSKCLKVLLTHIFARTEKYIVCMTKTDGQLIS